MSNVPVKPVPKAHYLSIRNLVKKFDDAVAVDHLDLGVERNELFALLGSSGSGKSTLLRMLAGMEAPTSGHIILDGEDITALPPYQRPINMMFQSYALFPHLTVEQNIAFGLKQDKLPREEREERVHQMLELVQMKKYARRRPHQLSGGQQQRVALARSLAKRPKLLLLDEPLGALDQKLRQQTRLELVNVLEKVGVTCIMVTHDQDEAMTMASRIGIMSEGSLVQVGTPLQVYEHPNCRFVAEFVGETNLFEGRLEIDRPDHIVIEVPALPRPIFIKHGIEGAEGMTVWVSVRPERATLSREQPAGCYNWAEGVVDDIAYMGSYSLYHLKLSGGTRVKAHVPSTHWGDSTPPTWTERVFVHWSAYTSVVLSS